MIDPAQSLKLNFTNLSEGDSLDAETWLYSPDSENGKTDDDLTEWLEGGTGKINYSTRSALTRRLEKKSKSSNSVLVHTFKVSLIVSNIFRKRKEVR